MRRLGLRVLLSLGASAIGLLLCAILLDDFDISAVAFPFAIMVFGLVNLLVEPAVSAAAKKWAPAAVGVIALVANAITLLITDIVAKGIDVNGVGAFVLGTQIGRASCRERVYVLV